MMVLTDMMMLNTQSILHFYKLIINFFSLFPNFANKKSCIKCKSMSTRVKTNFYELYLPRLRQPTLFLCLKSFHHSFIQQNQNIFGHIFYKHALELNPIFNQN